MFWTNLYFIKPVNVSLDTTEKDFLKINRSKSAGAKGDAGLCTRCTRANAFPGNIWGP